MSLAQRAKEAYKKALQDSVAIRRYTGNPGARTYTDHTASGHLTGGEPKTLVGNSVQKESTAIVYADDLSALTLPITEADKLVVRGREYQIVAVDDKTRRVGETLIAFVLTVRG